MTEVEFCQIIKGSNLFPGYKLHEEVGIAGVSCDMVYENGEKVFCIEAKMQLNFKLLEQACRWRTVASASFIAVPRGTITREKSAIIDELGDVVAVVLPTGSGRRLGSHHFAIAVGHLDVATAISALTNQDFYTTLHRHNDFQIRATMIAVILTTHGCYRRSIAGFHSTYRTIIGNGNSKVNFCTLHLLVGSKQRTFLIVDNDREILEFSSCLCNTHEHQQDAHQAKS